MSTTTGKPSKRGGGSGKGKGKKGGDSLSPSSLAAVAASVEVAAAATAVASRTRAAAHHYDDDDNSEEGGRGSAASAFPSLSLRSVSSAASSSTTSSSSSVSSTTSAEGVGRGKKNTSAEDDSNSGKGALPAGNPSPDDDDDDEVVEEKQPTAAANGDSSLSGLKPSPSSVDAGGSHDNSIDLAMSPKPDGKGANQPNKIPKLTDSALLRKKKQLHLNGLALKWVNSQRAEHGYQQFLDNPINRGLARSMHDDRNDYLTIAERERAGPIMFSDLPPVIPLAPDAAAAVAAAAAEQRQQRTSENLSKTLLLRPNRARNISLNSQLVRKPMLRKLLRLRLKLRLKPMKKKLLIKESLSISSSIPMILMTIASILPPPSSLMEKMEATMRKRTTSRTTPMRVSPTRLLQNGIS